ncbi:MAG: hypothetical protein JRJ29_04850 [Deltaproteobacteria bacterium]|nr:hypothetical protein [Deltaproteobacteria bacterium]
MLRKVATAVASILLSLSATVGFAQDTRPTHIKKWNPQTSKVKTQEIQPQSSDPCVKGKNCLELYGVETPEEAKKLIKLNKERVIKKRVGPGPVA